MNVHPSKASLNLNLGCIIITRSLSHVSLRGGHGVGNLSGQRREEGTFFLISVSVQPSGTIRRESKVVPPVSYFAEKKQIYESRGGGQIVKSSLYIAKDTE